MVEGEALAVNDGAKVRRVADAYVAKYGEGWRIAGLDGVLIFEVTPTTAFGFGRGDARVRPRVEGPTNTLALRGQSGGYSTASLARPCQTTKQGVATRTRDRGAQWSRRLTQQRGLVAPTGASGPPG